MMGILGDVQSDGGCLGPVGLVRLTHGVSELHSENLEKPACRLLARIIMGFVSDPSLRPTAFSVVEINF